MTKEERIERLEQEHNELKHRLDKLTLFLDEQRKEQTVSDKQYELLHLQWVYMQAYKNILDLRIDSLEEQHD